MHKNGVPQGAHGMLTCGVEHVTQGVHDESECAKEGNEGQDACVEQRLRGQDIGQLCTHHSMHLPGMQIFVVTGMILECQMAPGLSKYQRMTQLHR